MAASPLVHRAADPNANGGQAKQKNLTVLPKQNGHDDQNQSDGSDDEVGGDLAEQMNEQARRRFVKGTELFRGALGRPTGQSRVLGRQRC